MAQAGGMEGPSGRGRDAGHSLVEVSVILTVLGVLAALAIPSFRGIMPRVRLGNNVEILKKEIGLARGQAVAKSAGFRVVFATADESYTLQLWDAGAGAWRGLGTNRLNGTQIESVAGFVSDMNGNGALCSGGAWDSGDEVDFLEAKAQGGMNVPFADCSGNVHHGYVTLTTPAGVSPAQKLRIKVEPLGRIAVERWQGGSVWVEE